MTASQNENPDLLWACKGGGGGNFGAVVELTARLHPVDMLFTEIVYTFPIASAVRVMTAFQEWVPELPDRGHCWTEIRTATRKTAPAVLVEFTFAGPEEPGARTGRSARSALRASVPVATSIVTAPYLSTMRDYICAGLRPDECAYIGVSPHGVLPRPAFYAKSDLIRTTWPAEAFEALVEAIERRQADPVMTPKNYSGGNQHRKVCLRNGRRGDCAAAGDAGSLRASRHSLRRAVSVALATLRERLRSQTRISHGRSEYESVRRGFRAVRIRDTPIPNFPIGNSNITVRACSDYER